MDVLMTSIPAAQSGTTNGTSTGKGASSATSTVESFSALLAGQTGQENVPVSDGQPTDTELSLSMMLQMLQSLVNPIQPTVDQGVAAQSEDTTLPEMLIEAMNSNSALTDKLLQDPKLKKWVENADELLAALGNTTSTTNVGLPTLLKQPTSDSLKVQNTLLTLNALAKQQPDNPILKFLTEDLANTIEPLLPEIFAELKKTQNLDLGVASNSTEGSNESNVSTKKESSLLSKVTQHKYINKRDTEQTAQNDLNVSLQAAQPKQERFALKNVPISIIEQSRASEESTVQLVDLPTDAEPTANTFITIADLQKAQQPTPTVDKNTLPVVTAANFTEEMTAHVLKNMKITLSEGFSEAKLSLFPKNLGHIDVKISMHDGQLYAQFAADSLAGKQMLESQLPQLRQALLTQGLQVEKLEVTQSQTMSSSMFQEQRQPQTFNQSQRQPKNRSNQIEIETIDFNEDLEQMTQVRNKVNGSSFDVTA